MKLAYTDVRSIDWDSYLGWSRDPQCPWCDVRCEEDYDTAGSQKYSVITTILECPKCGWWAAKQKTEEETVIRGELVNLRGGRKYVAAILKHFDPSRADVGVQELRRYLARNYSDIRSVNPQKMEELVRAVFKDLLDCEVHYFTSNTYAADGGIDLVALEGEDGLETAIQVKRREKNIAESVGTIREFVGAMAIEGYRRGIFVTTGRYSKAAQKLPSRVETIFGQKVELDLIDAAALEDILRRTQSTTESHPWRCGIKEFRYKEAIPWDSFVDGGQD